MTETTATAMMHRHLRSELDRAKESADREINAMIEALTQAKKDLARDSTWGPDMIHRLGQAHAMVNYALANVAAKNAAVEAIPLLTAEPSNASAPA